MKIRRILTGEVETAEQLLPENWNADLTRLCSTYEGSPDFHPLVAVKNSSVAAYGQALIFEESAWLGNIFVGREFRGLGLGRTLTDELIDRCYDGGARSIHLIATDMGEPLYKRIGFNEDTRYLFYRGSCEGEINSSISPVEEGDWRTILNINYRVTGEVRDSILKDHLSQGFKYLDSKGNISGFYLPTFGNGMILAMSDQAGRALLRFKHSTGQTISVLSEENQAGVDFCEEMNFTKTAASMRMYFGAYTEWHPACTFSRGTTYTG